MDSIHNEVNWQELLQPRKAKLPSIAAMEGGESEAPKIKLFGARFPLSSTWLRAANRLDSSPQLRSWLRSYGLAVSVLYTQSRGQRGLHHVNCFCLVLSLLSTPAPSAYTSSPLPHSSGGLLSNQAPSSLSLFL